jgi:hypothetical protein
MEFLAQKKRTRKKYMFNMAMDREIDQGPRPAPCKNSDPI